MLYTYTWGNNPKRTTLNGRECHKLASGKMHSVLVEFENGQREIVSFRALRKIKRKEKMKFEYLATISGGRGPDAWDREVTVSGDDITIRQALEEIEKDLPDDAAIVAIEQLN